MKTIYKLTIISLIFFIITNSSTGQQLFFQTMKVKDDIKIPKSKWYIEFNDFSTYYTSIDDKLLDNKQDNLEIISKIYFDDRKQLGLIIDSKDLEIIEITIEGEQIDPFKDDSFPTTTSFIDISKTVQEHIKKKYEKTYSDDPQGLQEKVLKLSKQYLRMGGFIDIKIKFKENDFLLIRIVPEQYGISWFNKALPINVQYTPSLNMELNSNAVSLYYPFQFIQKDLNRRKLLNWTSITNKISFGPYVLASIEKNVNFLGFGGMVGIGLSPKGLPIIGGGVAWLKESSNPTLIFTINPVEIGRLLFNPSEILKN